MTRVAFETQRDREDLLIERGEQYKRAIQLYVVANKRFPSKLEKLDKTNAKRYLRRRYVDPLTGKDEWRLIHVNAAGQLTDSLVQKPPAAGTNAANNPLGGSQPGGNPGNPLGGSPLGGNQPPAPPNTNAAAGAPDGQPQPVNAAVLRRPGDRPLTPNFGAPNPAFPNQE